MFNDFYIISEGHIILGPLMCFLTMTEHLLRFESVSIRVSFFPFQGDKFSRVICKAETRLVQSRHLYIAEF